MSAAASPEAVGRQYQEYTHPASGSPFFFWVWEPFLYGLNAHKQSVRRSKDTCQGGGPRQSQDRGIRTGLTGYKRFTADTRTTVLFTLQIRVLTASTSPNMQTTRHRRPRPATDYYHCKLCLAAQASGKITT